MKLLIAHVLAGISLAGFGSCAEYSEMAARFPLVDLSDRTAEQEVLEKDFATYQSTEVSGVDWSDVKTYCATVLKFEF